MRPIERWAPAHSADKHIPETPSLRQVPKLGTVMNVIQPVAVDVSDRHLDAALERRTVRLERCQQHALLGVPRELPPPGSQPGAVTISSMPSLLRSPVRDPQRRPGRCPRTVRTATTPLRSPRRAPGRIPGTLGLLPIPMTITRRSWLPKSFAGVRLAGGQRDGVSRWLPGRPDW